MRTDQFVLTERGKVWYEKFLDTDAESFGWVGREAHAVANMIERGVDYDLEAWDLMPGFEFLLKRGYIEKATDSIDILLEKLPTSGNLKRNLETYVRIARGLPVSDSNLEGLRLDLLDMFAEYGEFAEDDERKLPQRIEELRRARSRSDKIIAVDSAMQIIHRGGFGDMPTGAGLGEEEKRDIWTGESHKIVGRILGRLFHGEGEG